MDCYILPVGSGYLDINLDGCMGLTEEISGGRCFGGFYSRWDQN